MLKKCFDGFADDDGAIPADNVGSILSMMGMKVGKLLNIMFQLKPQRFLRPLSLGQRETRSLPGLTKDCIILVRSSPPPLGR